MKSEANLSTTTLSVGELGAFLRLDTAGVGARFKKEVLRVGEWFDPNKKKTFTITLDFLKALERNSNRWLSIGHRVPAPDGHTASAMATKGFWLGWSLEGDKLFGVFEPSDEKVANEIGKSIRDVSVFVRPETASNGEEMDAVIVHCALTPYPVVTGQTNFLRLSRESTEVPVDEAAKKALELEFSAKHMKKFKVLANLPDNADDDAVYAAVRAKFMPPEEKEDGEEDEAECSKAAAPAVAALSREVEALKATNMSMTAELARTRAKNADERLRLAKETLTASGTPLDGEIEKSVRELLVRGDAGSEKLGEQMLSLALSRAGTPQAIAASFANPGLKKSEQEKADADSEATLEQMYLSRNYQIEKDPKTGRIVKATPPSLVK